MTDNVTVTEADLRAAYPGAADAVVLHELHPLAPLMQAAFTVATICNLTPAQVVDRLKKSADGAIEAMPGLIMGAIRPQMDHPDFLRYVAGKMGAV